jgi:cytochrome c biogenesis protein CcmG/thiol:disulfide interchange protein DsbE
MKRALFGLLIACGLLGAAKAGPLTVGAPAPDFSVRTFDGKELTLADFRGQVLIINFWATWCGPCKEELPLLDAYYRAAIAKGYRLRIVAVTTEDSLPIEQLKPLAERVSFDMARNFRGDYRAFQAVPTNYVIDRAGILRYAQAGEFNTDSLDEILAPLLRHRGPAAPEIMVTPEQAALRQ